MPIVGKFTSEQDLSAFMRLGDNVKKLDNKTLEYGYFEKRHSSGLNYATLAAIHEYGWNKLPMRNFMTSTAILFRPELEKAITKLFSDIASGTSAEIALARIAVKATKKIEFVIDQGLFSNPKVKTKTQKWRQSVGTNNPSNSALFHYGDLKKGAEWRIV